MSKAAVNNRQAPTYTYVTGIVKVNDEQKATFKTINKANTTAKTWSRRYPKKKIELYANGQLIYIKEANQAIDLNAIEVRKLTDSISAAAQPDRATFQGSETDKLLDTVKSHLIKIHANAGTKQVDKLTAENAELKAENVKYKEYNAKLAAELKEIWGLVKECGL